MRKALLCCSLLLCGCQQPPSAPPTPALLPAEKLPEPTDSHNKFSKVIGWPADKAPSAPAGFHVTRFAVGLVNPRNALVAPNGDVFVAEANTESSTLGKVGQKIQGSADSQRLDKSANRISLLRDKDGDGVAEERHDFLTGLSQPYGMLILNNQFYVANTDSLWAFPYKVGDLKPGTGKRLLELPAGGYNNHWTRNLATRNGKIYISVGSGSNVAEHGLENEVRRANILEVDPQGKNEKIYAGGLRNPVGTAIEPSTKTLFAVVNERDELGDELVPDYLTSIKPGGFYGWPFVYFGNHPDPRMKGQQPPQPPTTPDLSLGAHTASLGLAFSPFDKAPYAGGAFIGQHGSWNRSELVGYKVVYVPFSDGKPGGPPQDFLIGFIADLAKGEVYGRPVGVTAARDALLVCDDAGNTIWRVAPGPGPGAAKP